MSAASNRIEKRPGGLAWMIWPVRVFSLLALGLAGYLFWSQASGSPLAGCDLARGFDCDAALSSRWGQWFGIPVLWVGAACYATIFASSWSLASRNDGSRALAWQIFTAATIVSAGAGLWFLGLQLVGKSSICPYCIAIHSCGLTIATLAGIHQIRLQIAQHGQPANDNVASMRAMLGTRSAKVLATGAPVAKPSLAISYAGAVLALAALVGGQIVYVPKQYTVDRVELSDNVDLDGASSTTQTSQPPTSGGHQSENPPASTTEYEESLQRQEHEAHKVISSAEAENAESPSTTILQEESNAAIGKKGSRTIEFLQGKLKLDVYEHPLLGNPEAEHVIVEFFDYTCPHCRKMHKLIEEVMPSFGDELAIVVLPVPNDILCNRYVRQRGENHRGACKLANLAVAIAAVDPVAFARLHDWIMEQEKVPSYPSSLSRVRNYTDESAVLKELSGDGVSERVQKYIELFAMLGTLQKSILPMQVIGDEIVTGSIESTQELRELWESKLGIKPAERQ